MSAICHEPDGVTPCRGERVIETHEGPNPPATGFERDPERGIVRRVCSLSRRVMQAGYQRTESGRLMRVRDPICGTQCWTYQRLIDTEGSDAQLERKAQEQEARA